MTQTVSTHSNKTLFVFRHGETDWNREGRMQGGTDIELNHAGRVQAQSLTEFFRLHPVEIFLSSDLCRAHETARIARGESTVPIVVDRRLRETNLGDAEGLTVSEIDSRFGKELLERWRAAGPGNDHFRFPNGESRAEHLARVREGIEEFLARTPHRTVGVASHGGAMRRLIHFVRPELTEPVMVGNCEVYKLEYDLTQRTWQLELTPVFRHDSVSRV